MYCGCPLPGNTIGQRLNHLTRRLSGLEASEELIPPDRPDALQATHPSDHNYVQGHSPLFDMARKQLQENIRKRKERDVKHYQKRKLDEKTYKRMKAHDVAFLYPVPFVDSTTSPCVAVGEIRAHAIQVVSSLLFI